MVKTVDKMNEYVVLQINNSYYNINKSRLPGWYLIKGGGYKFWK